MSLPSISVVLCTFNGEAFLEQQLVSIAAQKRPPDEMIICDDSSGDNTPRIISGFQNSIPFSCRVFFNEKRLGIFKNFEKGLLQARGELVVFADQDDVWLPEKLSVLEKAYLDNEKPDFMISDAFLIKEPEKKIPGTFWDRTAGSNRIKKAFWTGHLLELLIKNNSFVAGHSLAVKKELPDWFFPFPEEFLLGYHDFWLVFLLTAAGRKGILIEQPLVKYRQHSGQSSGGFSKNRAYRRRFLNRSELFQEQELVFRLIHTRLAGQDGPAIRPREMVQEKIKHLEYRGGISRKPLFQRLVPAVREYFRGGYEKYSLGILSLIRDLVS